MTSGTDEKTSPLASLEKILGLTVRISGLALILIAVIVSIEVILRWFFSVGSTIGIEYSGYILAISSAFAFSLTLLKRGHVRVDLIKVVSPRIEIFADVLAILSMLLLATCLAVFAFGTLSQSLSLKSVSSTPFETPLWIPQALWFVGTLVFALTTVAVLITSLIKITRGETADASAIISTPSIEEEVGELMHEWDADGKN